MIEYSKNKNEIMHKLKILVNAIGDADLDQIMPVRVQKNMAINNKKTKKKVDKK